MLPNDIIPYYIDDGPAIQQTPQTGTWEAYFGVPYPYAPAGAGTPVPRKQAVNSLMFRFDPPNDPSVKNEGCPLGVNVRPVWPRPSSLFNTPLLSTPPKLLQVYGGGFYIRNVGQGNL